MEYKDLKRLNQESVSKATNVECETELACEVKDILSMSTQVSLISAEVQDGKAQYKGRVIFNVIYLLEGEVRRKELGVEFLENCDLAVENGAKIKVELSSESVSANKINKLTLQAIITAKITAETAQKLTILESGDNYCLNTQEVLKSELCADLSGNFNIEDEVEISSQLKNVLSSSARVSVTGCQCGIGAVIVDGEIILSLALLPFDEKSDIIKENRTIPFRLELEGASVEVSDLSCADAIVNSVNLKVFVDEVKGKTTVSSEIAITLTAKAYKKQNYTYVDDLFCVDKDLSVARENITFNNFVKQKCRNDRVGGKAFCTPPENSRLVCVLEERVYGVSYTCGEDVRVEGVLSAHVLFENLQSGAISSRLAEIPFSLTFGESECVQELKCVCRSVSARLRSDEVEMEGELSIYYQTGEKATITAITQVEEGEIIADKNYAFSVYSATKNDTLWTISKALKTPSEIILAQNENLSFPLNEEQKIIVYYKR